MSTSDNTILSRLNKAREPKGKPAPKPPGKGKPKEQAPGLDEWFADRHKEMTSKCAHCGQRSCKGDPLHYKKSIAHILPKALFPSIATHPDNWIELCFWAPNSCHTNFDAHVLDLIQLNCFDLIIERFLRIYPAIAPAERRNIPATLLQYVDNNL